MSDLAFPTSLGISTRDTITLMGQDLSADLIGQVSFGELAFRLVTLQTPTPGQTRVFEAVLVALADHGFTPTAIAARLTYLSAPDAIQGALAAGLLGGGSRFLGVSEDTGRFLHDALATAGPELPSDDAGLGRPGHHCGAGPQGRRRIRARASATTSTRTAIRVVPSSSAWPARRVSTARIWPCSKPSAGSPRPCSARTCR